MGSNSKLFAALALGSIVESSNSTITWNTKVADILPEWVLQDPVATKYATLLDILSHRTGLPRHDISYRPAESKSDLIKSLRYLRPSAEFRAT